MLDPKPPSVPSPSLGSYSALRIVCEEPWEEEERERGEEEGRREEVPLVGVEEQQVCVGGRGEEPTSYLALLRAFALKANRANIIHHRDVRPQLE